MAELFGGISERKWMLLFQFAMKFKTMVAGYAILGEGPHVQNRLLVLCLEDDQICKFIVGNEVFDAIPINQASLLTHFLG
jgi:hypothetical protein